MCSVLSLGKYWFFINWCKVCKGGFLGFVMVLFVFVWWMIELL